MAIHAGNVSGSSTSTGSFGHIIKGGVNWNTAVSASAATAGFGSGGGGGGSDNMSWSDGTATLISGSSTSTGSFGAGGLTVAGGDFDSQVITRKWDLSTISLDKYMQDGSPEPEWGGNSWDLSASPDGLNVYVSIIGSSDTIIQYKLSGSWDIGSVSSTQSASFGSQDSMMRSMAWYSDGTKLITMGTGNDKFYQYSLSTPWDITTRTYVRTSTLYVLSACQGIEVRPDGLRLYSVHESDYLSEYEMTEPMDISTMTLVGTYSLAAQGTGDAYDVFFRGDGRYAYLFEKDSKYLCEWKLSTPWAFSTATYTGNNVNMPNNIKMTGNPEGTRLWGLDYSNDRINQYSWNGGTDTYNTGSIDIIGKTGIHGDVTVAQTLEVYGKLKGYSAEFKGDVSSSITSTGSFGHIMKSGVNWDTAVSASAATAGFGGGGGGGSSFTAAGISGSWQSYTLISGSGQIATQISGAFTSVSSSLASRITTREAFTTQSFSDGTSTTISGSVSSTGSFGHIIKGGVNWDTAVSASAATAGFGSGGGGGGGTITALNNATANELVTIGSTTTELDAESNLTFDGSTLTVTGDAKVTGDIIIDDGGSLKEAGGTAAITFDGSGHVTKIGQASPSSDEVLTWDGSKWASAAVTATVTGGTGMTATGTTLGGIVFKSDSGLTGSFSDTITISTGSMYVTSASLITPSISSGDIDITTAVHIKGSKDAGYTSGYGFDGGVSISSNLYDLYFSPDGRKLFVLDGHTSRTIYSFELKTPWDIATQQYIGKGYITYGISEDYPQGFAMHPDGTYVYFVGTTIDGITEFALTIPWDLTTMTVGKSINIGAVDNAVNEDLPYGIDWKPDGTKVYIAGDTTNSVLQYAVTGSAFDIGSLSFEKSHSINSEESSVKGVRFSKTGTQMFIIGTSGDSVDQYHLSRSWDVGTATHVGLFSVNSEEPHPHGLFLKPDNSGFYVAGTGGDEINEYSLTKPNPTSIFGDVNMDGGNLSLKGDTHITGSLTIYDQSIVKFNAPIQIQSSSIQPYGISMPIDITTAVHIKGSKDAGYTSGYGFDGGVSISSNLYDLYFSPDGRKLFVLDGHSSRTIYSFELKTPWDIATQQYILKKQITYGISEQYPQGFTMHPDGTYVYFVGNTIDGISEFALTIPWDLTTMTVGKSIDLDNIANRVASESAPKGIDWKPDGTKVYIVGQTTDAVLQYAVTGSGFDIHSLSFEYQLDVPTEETYVNGIKFKQDGSQMFIVGTTEDEIYQYNLSKNWDISSARFVNSFSVSSEEPHPHGLFLKPDDSGFYVAGTGGDEINEYKFTHGYVTGSKSITIGASTDIYGDVDIKGKLTLQQPWANDFKTEANFNHGISSLTGSINVSNISNPIDITTAVHIKGSKDAGYTYDYGFDGNVSIDNAFDLYFSPDGRKLFVLYGQSSGKIYSFELKTPWDVLTQQYLTVQTLGTETQPFGMAFHPDGTKVYITGNTKDGITEFTLPIPWDLTTMTVGKSIDLDNIANRVASESTPYGIDWKPDGTKVYIAGDTTKSVLQYAVTGSAFDIGSLSFEYQLDVPIEESYPTAVRFKQDGSQMFIVGNRKDEVIQYNLSKNWDISTARFVNNFSVSSEENYSYGLFLKPDNSGFYIIGSNQDEVNEYSFTNSSITGSNNLSIGASTDIYGDVDIKGKLTLQQPWANDFKTEANFNHGLTALSSSIQPYGISMPIDITTAVHIKGSKDAGYTSGYGFDGGASIEHAFDLYFSSDGRKLFVLYGQNGGKIYSFELKTPWDVLTQQYLTVQTLGTETQPFGMAFHPDGTKVYITGNTKDGITEFTLPIPWDLTTMTVGKSIDLDNIANRVASESTPYGIDWKPDGTKVYVVGNTTKSVLQYAVTGSAFDIGSLSLEYQLDVPIEESWPTAVRFKQDGSQMFIVGNQKDEVIQYNLSKNWDMSTARVINVFSVSSEENYSYGLFLKPDNSGFYIIGSNQDEVNEYKFQGFDTGSYSQKLTIGASTDIYGDVDIKGKLTLQQPWANDFKTEANFNHGISSLTGSINVSNISNPIDITTAVYKQTSADPATIGDITDIYFKPDGKVVFLSDDYNVDKIYQYTLSTPWDISTLNTAKVAELSVSSQESNIYGFTMSIDGYWLFVVGSGDDGINSYNLTTPWDISTASAVKSINIGTVNNAVNEDYPYGIDWKPDGTKVYVVGTTTDAVLQYAVTGSAFDIGSLSFEYQLDVPIEETYVYGIKFKQDGSQMFIVGSTEDEIYQYNLSKNWDISSARFVNSFSVSSEESGPNGMFFKPDDSGFYVVGTGGEVIDEYTLGDSTTGRTFRDSRITGSASTLDMAGQVNLFGSLDVLQDINVLGHISQSSYSTASLGHTIATSFAGDGASLTNVPDYVYDSTYVLQTISELETFVTENKHLPNVPDMNDMDKWKILSVSDRDMLLLEKIEELSLYIIQLNKRIEDLENK